MTHLDTISLDQFCFNISYLNISYKRSERPHFNVLTVYMIYYCNNSHLKEGWKEEVNEW